MQVSLFFVLISFASTIPLDNPAVLDILKVVIGSTTWIGSMVAYMYWREKKLKSATANK
jgi:hypothetical protein